MHCNFAQLLFANGIRVSIFLYSEFILLFIEVIEHIMQHIAMPVKHCQQQTTCIL